MLKQLPEAMEPNDHELKPLAYNFPPLKLSMSAINLTTFLIYKTNMNIL